MVKSGLFELSIALLSIQDIIMVTGILENPYHQENRELPELHKKLFLVGKSGIGKTSTVDKLSGRGEWLKKNSIDTVLFLRYQTYT